MSRLRRYRAIVILIAAVAACFLASGRSATRLSAQTPSPTPAIPGSGGAVIGSVRVLSGNSLPRNTGQENQPPVWLTIDAKGTSAVVTVGNATRVPLDFNGTVVISLAPDVAATGTVVSTGTSVIQGNQVVWSGFSLTAGQIVPGIVVLAPGSQQSTTAGPAISSVSIDAKDPQSGTVVTEQAAGGGPTTAVLAAAPVPATPRAGIAAAPIVAAGVVPLARADAQRYATLTLALLLAVLLAVVLGIGLIWQTGQSLKQRLVVAAAPAQSTIAPRGSTGTAARSAILPNTTWWLELRDGSEPARRWSLDAYEIAIGRNARNAVVVADPRVSDRHARLIQQSNGNYQIVDDGSTNGTELNGVRITTPEPVRENDVLRFGSTSFLVCHAAEARPSQPLPASG